MVGRGPDGLAIRAEQFIIDVQGSKDAFEQSIGSAPADLDVTRQVDLSFIVVAEFLEQFYAGRSHRCPNLRKDW